MARTRTLAQLRADVQYRADIVPGSQRHPDANINRLINESWQKMRVLVSDNGHQLYLKASSGNLTPGLTSPYAFGTLALPTDLIQLYAVDVSVTSTDVRSLDVISFTERNEWRSVYGSQVGVPTACHIFNVGTESTTTVTAGTLMIAPAPDLAYAYTLWYLPSWTDVSTDANVFNGYAGWEEFVIWDVVLKLAARDNDMQNTAAIAQGERAAALEAMLKVANAVQRVGPATRVDASRRTRTNSRADIWRRP